jgi:hypothetical protein
VRGRQQLQRAIDDGERFDRAADLWRRGESDHCRGERRLVDVVRLDAIAVATAKYSADERDFGRCDDRRTRQRTSANALARRSDRAVAESSRRR